MHLDRKQIGDGLGLWTFLLGRPVVVGVVRRSTRSRRWSGTRVAAYRRRSSRIGPSALGRSSHQRSLRYLEDQPPTPLGRDRDREAHDDHGWPGTRRSSTSPASSKAGLDRVERQRRLDRRGPPHPPSRPATTPLLAGARGLGRPGCARSWSGRRNDPQVRRLATLESSDAWKCQPHLAPAADGALVPTPWPNGTTHSPSAGGLPPTCPGPCCRVCNPGASGAGSTSAARRA